MEKNIGKTDKWIRISMAGFLFPLLFITKGPARWMGILSIPLLGTALANRCGLYTILGKSTCKIEN
ncbi:YgaP family membrane protein [Alkalibacterium psychrotolerans]